MTEKTKQRLIICDTELHRDIEKHIICDNFPDWQAMHGNTNNLKKERREGLWWQLNLPDQS